MYNDLWFCSCTGPSSTVMIGGCNSCNIGIEQTNQRGDTIITCMDPNEESCPIGFYRHTVSQSNKDNPLAGKTVSCHSYRILSSQINDSFDLE